MNYTNDLIWDMDSLISQLVDACVHMHQAQQAQDEEFRSYKADPDAIDIDPTDWKIEKEEDKLLSFPKKSV